MFDSILIGAKEKVPTCGTLYKNVNRFVWNFLIRDDNKFCRNDDDNGVTYLRMTMQPRPFRIECNLKSKPSIFRRPFHPSSNCIIVARGMRIRLFCTFAFYIINKLLFFLCNYNEYETCEGNK